MTESDYTPEYAYTMNALAYQFVSDYEPISGKQLIELASFFRIPMPHANTKNAIIDKIATINRNGVVHRKASHEFVLRAFAYATRLKNYLKENTPDITSIPDRYLNNEAIHDKQVILAERGGYVLL